MKILIIAPSNSVHTTRWIKRTLDSGIEVDLYDLASNDELNDDLKLSYHFKCSNEVIWFSKVPVFGQFLILAREFFRLRKAIRFSKPDIIHCHWLFHSAPFFATYLAKGIPLIATPWGSDIQVPLKPLRGRLKKVLVNRIFIKRIARKSTNFCCDSNKLADILAGFGADRKKIKLIYFGTDVEAFSPKNRSESLREKFGAASATDVLIISNRSHEPIYDIPTLILAAKDLRPIHPTFKYVIAGSGSLTSKFKQMVADLSLEDIFYFTGRLDDSEFTSATASCDIYVSTSTSDGGLAASTAEAMACEVPVIVTRFGENSLFVDGLSTGLLFEIGDVEDLKRCIISLGVSPNSRKEMGQEARRKIVTSNNSKVEWKKVLSLYGF